jgi:hypothetical protein
MQLEWNYYGKKNQRFVMINGVFYPVSDLFEAIDKVTEIYEQMLEIEK